jgi:hypothetical protein
MPPIKSLAAISEKWARVAPQRSEDYLIGVQNPRVPWDTAAIAAEPQYASGVQAAIGRKAFSAGVRAAGNEKYRRRATELGPSRFATGTQSAKPDYEKGFGPFRQVIESTTLPPRKAKGDPGNIERVRAMAQALSAAKRK